MEITPTFPSKRLKRYSAFCHYSDTLIWNSIPLEIGNANTIGDFVKKM